MYRVSTYYMAKTILEIPILVIVALLYDIIVYFGIGTTVTCRQFFFFFFVSVLIVNAGAAFGYFLSSIFN